VADIPEWTRYSDHAANFVFRLPRNESYVEDDGYRADGIKYINGIAR
jgi:acetylcholinesterase